MEDIAEGVLKPLVSKMHPEIKAKWVEALRSGKYEQGSEYLRRDDTYCCLGVLEDLMGCQWEESEYESSKQVDGATIYLAKHPIGENSDHHYQSLSVLTSHISYELGFDGVENPHIFDDMGHEVTIAELNDNGATFAQLADLIEAHL